MIIPEKEKKGLIVEMLRLMHVQSELQEQQVKTLGKYLLEEGIKEDVKGNPIQSGVNYMWPRTVNVPINHERRMRHIIESAKDLDDMNTQLAAHLVKYGKPYINNIDNNLNSNNEA